MDAPIGSLPCSIAIDYWEYSSFLRRQEPSDFPCGAVQHVRPKDAGPLPSQGRRVRELRRNGRDGWPLQGAAHDTR